MKNKPIKVCMLTTSFPRRKGDYAASFIYDLCKKLVENGIKVNVVAPHHPGARKYEEMDGIEVYRFQYMWPKETQKLAYGGGMPHNLRTTIFAICQLPFFFWFFFIKGVCTAKKCDIIHAHWVLSGLIGVFIKKFIDKPLVLTVHGSDVNILPSKGLIAVITGFLANRIDKIIAVSESLKEGIAQLGVYRKRISILPNGVDTEIFSPVEKEKNRYNLLWIGRLTEEKGLKHLINAIPLIVKTYPSVSLKIVGDGPLRKELEEQAIKLGVMENIIFKGSVSHDSISKYFDEADILVHPSLSEGFGITLIEALSSGIPVVASKVGGIIDIVDDNLNGFLVEPKKPEQIAEKVNYLLDNPNIREKFGNAGRKKIENKFSWEKIAGRTIGIYGTLLGERV